MPCVHAPNHTPKHNIRLVTASLFEVHDAAIHIPAS